MYDNGAYNEGWSAQFRHQALSACPYSLGTSRYADWMLGFCGAARAAYRAKVQEDPSLYKDQKAVSSKPWGYQV